MNFFGCCLLCARGGWRFAGRVREVRYIVNSRGEMRADCDAASVAEESGVGAGGRVCGSIRSVLRVFRSAAAQHQKCDKL